MLFKFFNFGRFNIDFTFIQHFIDAVSDEQYEHFLYLHAAIRILSSKATYNTENQTAKEYLRYFVYRFSEIYGQNHLIYNVHSLIHLADECLIHGPLETFSAFPFETYLAKLKGLIRTPFRPLAQLVNRIGEINRMQDSMETQFSNVNPMLNQQVAESKYAFLFNCVFIWSI